MNLAVFDKPESKIDEILQADLDRSVSKQMGNLRKCRITSRCACESEQDFKAAKSENQNWDTSWKRLALTAENKNF